MQTDRAPDVGLVRTTRIAAGVLIIIGMLGFGWGRYAGGPEVLCLWIATVFNALGVCALIAMLILRARQRV